MSLEKIASAYTTNQFLKETVIKEILHYEILETMYRAELLNEVVFQGGTALRLCYENNRYSEDLDFVLTDESIDLNDNFMGKFKELFVEKIAKKYGLNTEITESKNDEKLVQKWTAKVYLPLENRKSKINIEIAKIRSYDNDLKLINSNYKEISPVIFVRVESLEEILADKMVALGGRDYLKFRDLWDIKWLKDKNIKTNLELIEKKIADYKIEGFYSKLATKLEQLEQPQVKAGFETEMRRFLDNDVFEFVEKSNFFSSIKKIVAKESLELINSQKADNKKPKMQR